MCLLAARRVCAGLRNLRRPARLQTCYGLRRSLEQLAHAVERQMDVSQVVGVAEPEKTFAIVAEGGPRQTGHAGLLEQAIGQIATGVAGLGDVREGVEGTLGFEATHARQRIQTRDD